jgi:hypothetical protein
MTTTHPRAKTNGQIAPNGESYKRGQFIATTEMPKRQRVQMEKKQRQAETMAERQALRSRLLPLLEARYGNRSEMDGVAYDYRFTGLVGLAAREFGTEDWAELERTLG